MKMKMISSGLSSLAKSRQAKKAVIYVGNLKVGAQENEVAEYVKRRCEKLRIRPLTIHNCKIFEKEADEGEIVESCGARLTIDQGPLEIIFQNALSPYQRVRPSFLYSTASTL